MNSDGNRDGADISAFVGCVIQGRSCVCADVDNMNGVTIDDVAVVVADLLAGTGCPEWGGSVNGESCPDDETDLLAVYWRFRGTNSATKGLMATKRDRLALDLRAGTLDNELEMAISPRAGVIQW